MRVKARPIKDSYLDLIKEFPLRKLGNADEHREALAVFFRFAGRKKLDQGIVDYLDILADIISDYERLANYVVDTSKVSPAEVVRHLMNENGLTISGLARELGVGQSNLSEILSGKREWSKNVIRALCQRFFLNPILFLTQA
jgi:antitoxin component HigA of HigAB toxin-antitoxin module